MHKHARADAKPGARRPKPRSFPSTIRFSGPQNGAILSAQWLAHLAFPDLPAGENLMNRPLCFVLMPRGRKPDPAAHW